MKTINRFNTLAAALLLLASGSSFASDDHMTTGATCSPLSNAYVNDFYYRPTSIQNVSTGYRYISCPTDIETEGRWDLEDMDGGTDNGNALLIVSLDYSQNTVGGTTTCTAQVIDNATNTFVETKTGSLSGAAGTAANILFIGPMYKGDANESALAFNCNLPPGVRLTTINVEEYAHTDDSAIP